MAMFELNIIDKHYNTLATHIDKIYNYMISQYLVTPWSL